MLKMVAHPLLIRFALWLAAALVAAAVFLEWSGGFSQLLESINDIF
jgi:hypothetical protein